MSSIQIEFHVAEVCSPVLISTAEVCLEGKLAVLDDQDAMDIELWVGADSLYQ